MGKEITGRLFELKQKISDAQTKYNRAQGKLQNLNEQLKEYGCSNVKQARKMVDDLDSQIEKNEKLLENGVKELEKLLKGVENED